MAELTISDTPLPATGPGHVATQHTADGRPFHTFSKSWVSTHEQCPEKARRILAGIHRNESNTASFLGTCFHSIVETILRQWVEAGHIVESAPIFERAYDTGMMQWVLGADDHSAHKSIKSIEHGSKLLARMTWEWLAAIPQLLHPDVAAWEIERTMRRTIVNDETRRIDIHGTSDLWDSRRVWDWKTGRVPPEWMLERYDLQSTIYMWLAECDEFSMVYIPREHPGVVIVPIVRHQGHRDLLTHRLEIIATMIEADLPAWPLSPIDYWCSTTWCSAMADGHCAGQFVTIQSNQAARKET